MQNILDDDIEDIVPSNTGRRLSRLRRRRIALAVVSVLLAASASVAVWKLAPYRCQMFNFDLVKEDGQCVGITNGDYSFDPNIASVSGSIAAENRRVRDQWSSSDPAARVPYVTIAVMMPLTSSVGSPLSEEQIRVSLEGAYVAQYRANHTREIRDPSPLIQLTLANTGSHQRQWLTTVKTLLAKTDKAHPLVAVVGMGASLPVTREAADWLSAHRITAIGAVIAASDMTSARLFEAGPSTSDYADALKKYTISRHKINSRRVLVYDDSQDNFTASLRRSFQQAFDGHIADVGAFRGQANSAGATPDVFTPTVQNICLAKAEQILFAGRFRDLVEFVRSLASRSCRTERRVEVVTASTGLSTIFTPQFEEMLIQGNISISYASATSAESWEKIPEKAATGYQPFHRAFTDNLHFPEADLSDGYSIMSHDAVMIATWATRLAPPGPDGLPSDEDIFEAMKALHGTNAIPAASGTLSYHEGINWPAGKLVPIQQYPSNEEADSNSSYSTAR